MLSDAQVAVLERWAATAEASATATQAFVTSSTDLAIASHDAADALSPAQLVDGNRPDGHGELAVSLRELASAIENESSDQRDGHPLTAEILVKLRSLDSPPGQ
jgi:hypothetical protein